MKKRILSLILAVALIAGGVGTLLSNRVESTAAVANSVQDARDKIAAAQAEQARLAEELKNLQSDKSDALDRKSVIDRQLNAINEQIAAYESVIAELDADIAQRQAQLDEAQAKYDENIERFRAQACAVYERGQVSYLEVLLGSQSFSDFLLRVDYVRQVSAKEKELLETIRESVRVIAEEKEQIEANRAEQQASLDALEVSRAEATARSKEIESIISQIKSSESALQAAQKKEQQAEDELNAFIEKELANANSNVQYQQGDWIWPVGKASYNYVSSKFGWRTLSGKREFHYAIDIAAPRGTPVYAAKAGTVKSAGWVTTGGGWQVCIDHGGSYYTYYNHMNARPVVSAGQTVKQGQIVGYVGDSGYAFGTHLDFKIYYNGKAQDPLNYVKNPY